MSTLQAMRAAIHAVLPSFPAVRRVYLFGSVLRSGAMRAVSDVDVAVEGELSAEEYFALWRELERAAPGWAIDLVEIERTPRLAARIRETGELIYERDPGIESRHRG